MVACKRGAGRMEGRMEGSPEARTSGSRGCCLSPPVWESDQVLILPGPQTLPPPPSLGTFAAAKAAFCLLPA